MAHETNRPRRGPMGHGPGPGAPVEKAKDFQGTIRKILAYMSSYKPALIVVMIFAVASTVFSIVGPKILGKATTELFTGLVAKVQGTGSIDFTKITRILLFLLCIYLCSALFSFIQIVQESSQKRIGSTGFDRLGIEQLSCTVTIGKRQIQNQRPEHNKSKNTDRPDQSFPCDINGHCRSGNVAHQQTD